MLRSEKRPVLVLIAILSFQSFVFANLSLTTTQCGSLTCKEHQYCSQYDNQCKPCEDICDKNKHNTDSQICERDCQDYLHDARYVKTGGISGDVSSNSQVDIQKVYNLAVTALVLSCFLSILVIALIIFKLFGTEKNNKLNIENLKALFTKKTPSEDVENKTPNNGVSTISGKPDLRLDIPSPGVDSDVSPTTMTTSISRRPAEDLAYAYDNHAMSAASSPNNIKINRDATY